VRDLVLFLAFSRLALGLPFGSHGMDPCVALFVMAGADLDRRCGNGDPACRFYCGMGDFGIVGTKAVSD
jgi:hypothetical protein